MAGDDTEARDGRTDGDSLLTSPETHVFFYGKKKSAVAVLIGLAGAALSVWVIVTGADYGVFSGAGAVGVATMVLGVAALMVLIGLPRLLFQIVLITADSEGLRVRSRLGRMKRIRWDQLRWIEYPTRSASCFRIRSSSGGIEVNDLSNEDRLRLFKIVAKRRVPIRPNGAA